MDGRATFTAVMSSPTMRRLIEQISRTAIRRLRPSWEVEAIGGSSRLDPYAFRIVMIISRSYETATEMPTTPGAVMTDQRLDVPARARLLRRVRKRYLARLPDVQVPPRPTTHGHARPHPRPPDAS